MHEATIADAILKKAIAIARQEAALSGDIVERESDEKNYQLFSIVSITIRLGEFRNVDPESLQFVFGALRKDLEMTANASLKIERVPTMAYCRGNRHRFHPEISNYYGCSECESGIDEIIEGNELYIVLVETHVRSVVDGIISTEGAKHGKFGDSCQ